MNNLEHVLSRPQYQRWSIITLTLLLISSLMLAPTAFALEAPKLESPQLTSESATSFVEEFFANPDLANYYHGAAVTIVKEDELLVQEGFGHADVSSQEVVDPSNTVFRIASVSKSFTAIAVMQLVEQGLIDLDADIRAYLGDLDFENPFEQPVTMKHLLSHTSGFEISDPKPADFHNDFERFVEIEDYVRTHMPSVVREPGTAYMYGNFDSMLQGLIVQNVSGQPFQLYMDEHIFDPLDMNNSGFLLEDKIIDSLATGYDPAGQPIDVYAITPTVMPHGGMLTTASDMGKFMIAFLADGISESERILSKEAVQDMSVYRTSSHDLLPNTTYGFEAARQLPGAGSSDQVITKAGDLTGFSSYLWFIPEEDVGVFVTYNNNRPIRDLLYSAFIAKFYPQYAAPAELGQYTPSPNQDMSRFEGLYVDLRLSSIVNTVKLEDNGNLTISNAFMGQFLLHQVDELLFVDENGMLFGFRENEDGSIAYLDEPYLNPLGYSGKVSPAAGFSDITTDHPYSEYIYALQSLGLYPNKASEVFEPERPVTRAEYIKNLMKVSGLEGSKNPPAFTDVVGHPAAPEIQFAYEMGIIAGNGQAQYEPDRSITRQEAASIVWRSYAAIYPPDHFEYVELSGETDTWAVSAVKMMVGLGLYGPEVQPDSNGAIDFLSKQPMLRQEEAVHHYLLLTKPTLNVTGGETEVVEEVPISE